MDIEENIQFIKDSIPEYVSLIAVSKTKPVEDMLEAYNFGIRDFAENKVQELNEKITRFGSDVRWHFIGHLQRNKVKYIAGKVFLIQSLDSTRLLEEIEKQYSKIGEEAHVLIELNIGRETSKTGLLEEDLEALISEVEKCQFVKVKGLMTVIPKGDEASSRQYFVQVKNIWNELKERHFKNISMEYLSMGMSQDYKLAVEEGSNMIRIGEGIFGKRNYNNN